MFIVAGGMLCCNEMPKDFVTLSGKITNPNSDSLVISDQSGPIKLIRVDGEGNFADTLKLDKAEIYNVFDGGEYFRIFLRNGFDLNISLDTKEFDESLLFKGEGEMANNYLAERTLLNERVDFESLLELDSIDFYKKRKEILGNFEELLKKYELMDSVVLAEANENLKGIENNITRQYTEKLQIRALNGQMAPEFTNYENHKGGVVSLSDLRGKYVYIDLWATWCAPCKKEIPFLKKIEATYHDRNIVFVSISLDNKRKYETWKKMVGEEELPGLQLYYNGDKEFTQALIVQGIPRFILIDPQGRIVDSDAPRPSDERLKELFNDILTS